MRNKVFFHIDMNAFFANVERLKNPKYKNRPIVIARENKRAVVITCTYDLRKRGVRVGKPIYKIKPLCPQNTLFIDPNYFSYSKYSIKIFNFIYHNFTTKIEINSIDECYIDVTELWKKYGSISNLALKIINDMKQKLQLPCSIGVSFSKFYAKLANNLAKNEDFYIISPQDYQKKHWKRPITEFYMVGVAMAKILNDLGIKTGLDYVLNFNKYKNTLLKNKNYLLLYNNIKGERSGELEYNHNYVQTLGRETTLIKHSSSLFEIKEKLLNLVENNILRAKKINVLAKTFVLKITYSHEVKSKTYSFSFKNFTIDHHQITTAYKDKLEDVFEKRRVKLIGCYFKNIVSKYDVNSQLSIFDIKNDDSQNLTLIVEAINTNYKKEVISTLKKWADNKEFGFQNRFTKI